MSQPKKDQTQAYLGGFLVLLFAMWLIAQLHESHQATQTPRTDTDAPNGFKTFYRLKESLKPGSAVAIRRPILKISDLEPFNTYFIASPKMNLSIRESQILMDWVEAGGKLVLAFHDNVTLRRLESLSIPLNVRSQLFDSNINDIPNFENGTVIEVTPRKSIGPFQADETYEFYTRLRFQDFKCTENELSCFVRSAKVGDGEILLIAGLAPFSNGMILRASNARASAQLALNSGRVGFDEFHLLLTEKTLQDLLTDPSFALPVLGLLIGVLLFFTTATGDSDESAMSAPKRRAPSRSLHGLGRLLVRNVVTTDEQIRQAAARHVKFLNRLIPKKSKELQEILSNGKSPDATVQNLIEEHRKWLKSRGRK